MVSRNGFVQMCLADVGKCGSGEFLLAVGIPDTPANRRMAWCGIWNLAKLRQAGLTTEGWKIGVGFIDPMKLPMVKRPEPGDIAYFTKHQHHAIVTEVRGDSFDMVQGNGLNNSVTVSTDVPLSRAAAFYSIGKLLEHSCIGGK